MQIAPVTANSALYWTDLILCDSAKLLDWTFMTYPEIQIVSVKRFLNC